MQPLNPELTDNAQALPVAASAYNEGNAHFRAGRWRKRGRATSTR
jgi:hypothetical protein